MRERFLAPKSSEFAGETDCPTYQGARTDRGGTSDFMSGGKYIC